MLAASVLADAGTDRRGVPPIASARLKRSDVLDSDRVRTLLVWALIAVVVAPMFVAAGSLAARGWHPTSDLAQAELRMQAFWSAPPEIGAAGRIGDVNRQGAHPGPAAWWAMYPFYALLGRTPGALSLSVAAVAGLFAALSIVLARAVGGPRAALCVAASLAVAVRALGPTPFVEPWNPYLGIFPFAAFLVSVWGVLAGRPALLAVAALTGSFAVQQHVGYIPLVCALGALATARVAVMLRSQRRTAAEALGLAAAGSALMWALPIHQQLTSDHGNLGIVVNSFRHPESAAIGLGSAVRVTSGIFGATGTWILRSDVRPVERSAWLSFGVLLIAWGGAAMSDVAARRHTRNNASRLALHGVVAASLVVGIIATSRIFGEVFDYLIEWMRIVAAFAVAATLWTVWDRVVATFSASQRRVDRVASAAVVVVVAVATLASLFTFGDVETPGRRLSAQMGELAEVTDVLDRDLAYVVRWSDPVALGALGFGTVLELERDGFDVGADEVFSTAVLPSRVMEPGAADRSLWVVTGDRIDVMRGLADTRELAYVDVRTPEQVERVDVLRDRVRQRLLDVGGPDLAATLDLGYWNVILNPDYPPDLADEIAELGDLGLPSAIFSAPPDLVSLPAS